MTSRRIFPLTLAGTALVLASVAAGFLLVYHPARALPPAGSDYVGIDADVSVTSRLGSETIHFTGTGTIVRQDPHLESGAEVVDDQISTMDLLGQSATGSVHAAQNVDYASTGQIRSLNPSPQEYPASSFFDVVLEVSVPAGSGGTLGLHNDTPIHLVASSNINSWPPYGVSYDMQPVPTTPTPTPVSTPPGGTPSCDNGIKLLRDTPDFRDPDPWLPAAICITNVTVTLSIPPSPTPSPTLTPTATPCVPTCTPTPTPTGPPPTRTQQPSPSPTPTRTPGPYAPGDTTFSVAPGGPSGLHPADLLARGPSTAPIAVSGNDSFAQAWPVSALPFNGMQHTLGFTTEGGEPLTTASPDCISTPPNYEGATAWYHFTPGASGAVDVSTAGSDYDTVLAVYTGSALNSLSRVVCDDDAPGILTSFVSFDAVAGTTYYVQAGVFDGNAPGNLRLSISMAGSGGSGGVAGIHVAIPCSGLGLTPAGCGASGTQDNLDALSFGRDFGAGDSAFQFSVAPGSAGLSGSAVAAQAACTPAEPQADEFSSDRDGTNALVLDGDGASNDCPSATPANLIERPTSDNLDASSGQPPDLIDTNNDGALDEPVYFSLAAGSPSLSTFGRGPADILWTVGYTPGLYASAAQLGLQPSDDIDALCVLHTGAGQTYDPAHDKVLFALAPGSPTLAALGASAADILAPGPKVDLHAWELGLKTTDQVDALNCNAHASSAVTIPVGDFYFCDQSYQGIVCETVVHAGDTVEWNFASTAHHTTTECGVSCDSPTGSPLWDSGPISSLDPVHTFSHTFNTPGTYLYYCSIHPTMQRGRIIVQPAGGGTPTPTPTPAGLVGDANKDGQINSVDALLVLQYTAGLISSINANGDANQNGDINAIDATLILQYVAGLLSHLPP